jgi:CheY-like chemotaxis protein
MRNRMVLDILRWQGKDTMGRAQDLSPLHGRVLVVDDDPGVRAFLAEFLALQDLAVRTAQDGAQALAIFGTESFDLVMVDLQMPGMSGLEVAAVVRQTHQHIPIALVTGTVHALHTEALRRAGITRVFQKPFDLKALQSWIRSLPL